MSHSDFDQLTRSELLLMEEICDNFERDLREGEAGELNDYIPDGNERLIQAVKNELLDIEKSLVGGSRTRNDAAFSESNEFAPPKLVPQAGTKLDRFELIEKVGSGATATVWSAKDLRLERKVAIKVLHNQSEDLTKRFLQESTVVARLRHPNIVSVHEVNNVDGCEFLVSDFIEGQSLSEILKSSQYSVDESVQLMVQLVSAVEYLHSQGVIHRDIKPQNILIDENGTPFLTDFGLARLVGVEREMLTRDGEIVGTPAYMAPEQAAAKSAIDQRTDVYALGILLFQLLTGDIPFRGSIQSVIYQILHRDVPPLREWNRRTPVELETITLKCLHKDPRRRFQAAEELLHELQRYQKGEPILSRPVTRVERFTKWARRNPSIASLGAVVTLLLIGIAIAGVSFGLYMSAAKEKQRRLRTLAVESEKRAQEARRQKELALQDALQSKEIAEQKVIETENALRFVKSLFQESDPASWVLMGDTIGGSEPPTLRMLFQNASKRIQDEYLGDRITQARLHDTLGNCCRSLGMFDEARQLLENGQRIRMEQASLYDERVFQFESTQNRFFQAQVTLDQGLLEDAEREFAECLKFDAQNRDELLMVADISFHMGRLNLTSGKKGAEPFFERSLEIRTKFLPPESLLVKATRIGLKFSRYSGDSTSIYPDLIEIAAGRDWVSQIIYHYAQVIRFRNQQEFEDAANHYRKLMEILKKHIDDQHQWFILAQGEFCGILWYAGEYAEAFPLIETSIIQGRRMAPSHHLLQTAEFHLGRELARNGEPEKAITYLQSILEVGPERPARYFENYESFIWCNLVVGKTEEAIEAAEALMKLFPFHSFTEGAWSNFLAARAWESKDPAKSKQYDENVSIQISGIKKPPNSGLFCDRLARIFIHAKEFERAIEYAQAAVDCDIERFHEMHPRVANRRMTLAQAYRASGQLENEKRQLQLALATRKAKLPPDSPATAECRRRLKELAGE